MSNVLLLVVLQRVAGFQCRWELRGLADGEQVELTVVAPDVVGTAIRW